MITNNDSTEKIKDWIRILQRSLTLEAEYGYLNLLGREKYFNQYLNESFDNSVSLNLSDNFDELFKKLSIKYKKYESLEISQRKRLVIDSRKLLFKLSQSILKEKDNKNISIPYERKVKNCILTLQSDISHIKGVGKKIKESLNQLGLFNIKDLINYFPRTYLDYSNKENIVNLRPDNLYTCIATIKKVHMYKSKKNNNLSILNIFVFDETSSIRVTKFFLGKRFRSYTFFANQKNKYKPGTKLAISGKVKMTEYGRSFVDPQLEILNSDDNNNFNYIGKILPIYSLNESITNLRYIKIVREILSFGIEYPDILSKKTINTLSLLPINQALKNIHLPCNQESLIESKKRLVFDELFLLQLKFLIKKVNRSEITLEKNIKQEKFLLDNFLLELPFKLTESQRKVLKEIKLDLNGPHPMSRLLQGDVGSGKTIIAIATLLYVIEKGFQGALMVPTEVLAEQHYKKLINCLDSILVNVELLTGNTSAKKRKQILSNLVNGQIDILVGTHALFEDKVIFNSLGLVVIDEQHRFGVGQRNRLLSKGENTHLLSMTATPIPRTLALSLYGDLDISQITELPPGRIPVSTKIINDKNLNSLFKEVKDEINNGKQVYVILPLIEDSEKLNLYSANRVYEYLSSEVFKEYEVGLLHGKLNSPDKNKIINLFEKNKINILVSTTVIEVGIDVPNASIMIIYNSERFGLSQLHQLRGRVGRDAYQTFCYLVTSENNGLTNKRLNVLQKSNDGFHIAEKDLEIRGPGQILGYKQSGLPDFVLDNLPKNKDLINKARDAANNIISEDPKLENNILLKNIIVDKSDNKFIHDFLN